MTLLIAIALLAGAHAATAGPSPQPADVWVTLTTSGSDAGGDATFDEFELLPDGRARWNTNALGAVSTGCGLAAGRFETRVSAEQALRIGKLASAAARSQGKRPGSGRTRVIRNSLFYDINGRPCNVEVSHSTPEWHALVSAVQELQLHMQPTAAITLRAQRLPGGRVRATFLWASKDPVVVQLPERAADAFHMAGTSLSYAPPARPERLVTLGPGKTSFSVDFEAKPEGNAGHSEEPRLFYSNRVVLHHAGADPISGHAAPPPTDLCARLGSWPQ